MKIHQVSSKGTVEMASAGLTALILDSSANLEHPHGLHCWTEIYPTAVLLPVCCLICLCQGERAWTSQWDVATYSTTEIITLYAAKPIHSIFILPPDAHLPPFGTLCVNSLSLHSTERFSLPLCSLPSIIHLEFAAFFFFFFLSFPLNSWYSSFSICSCLCIFFCALPNDLLSPGRDYILILSL